ncbi:MAG: hypothetical protein WC435_00280 [Candidatus Paceibacterota bacterium]
MNYQNGSYLTRFLSMLSQTPPVGGLEISESFLRFSLFSGKNLSTASLKLPPGIVGRGRVENVQQFKEALKVLKNKLSGIYSEKEKVNVIVSLPFSKTYLQVFKIPVVSEKGLSEAIRLNMQMISPIPIETAYCDSEKIGQEEATGQTEFLGAFAPIQESDAFSSVLKEAGFNPIAIEFPILSLARFFSEEGHGFDIFKPYLFLQVSSEGVDFIILRNGKLYFDYFVSWKSIQGTAKEITQEAFNSSIAKAFQQVLNFYSGRWGNDLKMAVVLAQGGTFEAIKNLGERFGLEVTPFSLIDFPNIDQNWLVTLSLAMRGRMPRGKDKFITLSRVDTEDEYRNEQIATFSKFWRNISLLVLGFFLAILFFSSYFLKNALEKVENDNFGSGISSQSQVMADLASLKEGAQAFNRLVSAVKESEKERIIWSDFFEKIYVLAGNDISLSRIFYQSSNVPIVLSGKAGSVEKILSFRDRIMEEKEFSEVNLPLSNVSQAGPEVLFNLSFSFKRAETK